MKNKPRAWSWRSKLFAMLSLFAILPAGILTWIVLDVAEAAFVRSTLSSLEAIATAKASAIEQLTSDRRRDVERIATLLAPKLDEVLSASAELEEDASEAGGPAPPPPTPIPLEDAEALATPPAETPPATPDADAPPAAEEGEATEEAPPAQLPNPRQAELEQARRDSIDRLRRHLNLILWDQSEFEELLVIARAGRVLASTFSEHEGRSAAELEYFRNGQRTTYVQPVFMSPITERLTMVIATPITTAEGELVGVLAARLNLTGLYELINDNTGLGATGETVVGKIIGQELVFMAPTRHEPQAALERRLPATEGSAVPIFEAARGNSGAGDRDDYRGADVLAAWRPVPSLQWGLVVKIDEAEATAPVLELQFRTVQVSVVVLLLALLASILATRELVRPLRELKEATDKISRGDFDVRIDIREGDEIGELADSFERMVAAIKFFREHARPEAEEENLGEDVSDETDRS